jgi:hypothetical protein
MVRLGIGFNWIDPIFVGKSFDHPMIDAPMNKHNPRVSYFFDVMLPTGSHNSH